MKNPIKSLVHSAGRWYLDKICRDEFEQQSFRRINERPIELGFLFKCIAETMPRTVLDVGTGTTALPSLLRTCGCVVTAIDNVRDYWSNGMSNRHWHVIDDDITRPRLNSQYDMVSCISVLEHIVDHNAAMRSMFSLVAPGGFVLLTFPYNETRYVDNVYKLAGAGYGQDAPYVCQVYSRTKVDFWLRENNAEIVRQEYWQAFSGELWTFGKSLHPPAQTSADSLHQLTCLLLRKKGPGG